MTISIATMIITNSIVSITTAVTTSPTIYYYKLPLLMTTITSIVITICAGGSAPEQSLQAGALGTRRPGVLQGSIRFFASESGI